MVTDEERREVVGRLREINVRDAALFPTVLATELYKAVGEYRTADLPDEEWKVTEMGRFIDRLVDLIDPDAGDEPHEGSETVWQHLFGTPKRTAETFSDREMACTSSHPATACFGLDECAVCPLNNGLCSNHGNEVELTDYREVLDLLNGPWKETRVTVAAIGRDGKTVEGLIVGDDG